MRVLNRSADRFQQALEGELVTDDAIKALVETSRELVSLSTSSPTPDPAFVARLRERLMTEADTLPTPSPAAARAAAARRATTGSGPLVVVVGRGLPRAVAGAVASALLVAAVVGIASRSAVPGDALYPVKGWLDSVAVRLAGNDLDRGQTYLVQAQEHISDARALAGVSPGQGNADDINVALDAATSSVRGGQRALDKAFTETGNPQALLAMRDFTARALPQVDALKGVVPAKSLKDLGELEALLRQSDLATARRIAACGSPCNAALGSTLGPASLPGAGTTTASGSPTSSGGISVPSTAVTAPAAGTGASSPGGGVGAGGVGVGAGGGGASLSSGGATLRGPTISASAPVPSGTVKVPLPSATLSTGGVGASVPTSTLGPVTLPGATLTLP